MTTGNSTISMAYTPSASFLNGSYLQDNHQLYNDSINTTAAHKGLSTAFPFRPMMLIAELGGGSGGGYGAGDDVYVAATNDERLNLLLSCQQQQQQQRSAHEHQKQPMVSGNCSTAFGNYQQPTTSSTASDMFYHHPGHGGQLLFEQSNSSNNNNDRHPFCTNTPQQQSHYDFGGIGPPLTYDHYAGWLSVLPTPALPAPPISTITITTTTTISAEKSINQQTANQSSTRNDSGRSLFPEMLCSNNHSALTTEGRLLSSNNNNNTGNTDYRQQQNMDENVQRNNNNQGHTTNASDETKGCSDPSAMVAAAVAVSTMCDSLAPPPLDVPNNHPMTPSTYFGAAANSDYVTDSFAYSIPYNWGQSAALSTDQLLYNSRHREENEKANYSNAYNDNKILKNSVSSIFSATHKNESVKQTQPNELNFNYSDEPLTAEQCALKRKPHQRNSKSQMIDAENENRVCGASNCVAKSRANINNKTWTCTTCGKKYCSRNTLKTHLKQHHIEQKQFICQICGKSFSQAANLTAHKRVHTGEKPFQCCICYRPFSQSSSLVTHKRTHTGERPYPCAHCHKAFTDSSTLTKHLRTHTGQKPYSCRLCLMQFSQSGNLHRHMKTHEVASNIIGQRSINGSHTS